MENINSGNKNGLHECICTVLLIAYNHRPYIRLAIESVVCQKTNYNYKVHIFDDASTDGTSGIVMEYAELYPDLIIPFISEKSKGAQDNVWEAYKSVDTKYCAFLECDDFWCDEKKLQLQIDALEQNPDCSFCAHNTLYSNANDVYRRKEDGKLFVYNRNIRDTGKHTGDEFKFLYGAGWFNHSNSRLIRMSCVDLDGLTDKEDFLYDNCQFLYLLQRGHIYFIQRVMSVYNMNVSGAFTSLQVQKKLDGHYKRMLHINESTNYEFELLIYNHLSSFTKYWIKLDNIVQKRLKNSNEFAALIMRELKKLFFDTKPHYKLKKQAKHNIRELQKKLGGEI